MSTQSERFNCMKSQRDEARARVKELELEVTRLDAGWHEANGRALELGLERTKLQSLLTPRRIDEDTPDCVLVWNDEMWCQAWKNERGNWVYGAMLKCSPKWWLPMLPAPEEK